MPRNKNKNKNSDSDSADADAAPSLPPHVLKRIDDAFDRAVSERFHADPNADHQRPQKRRRIAPEAQPAAGGFLLDDDTDMGGGFIPEPVTNNNTAADGPRASHIPLSLIPAALQRLDFDPSDAAVLGVFASAASAQHGNVPPLPRPDDYDEEEGGGREEQEQFVSRADWHAVCAALIPSASVDDDDGEGEESPLSSPNSDSDSDRLGSADLQESESSSDEYVPEPKSSKSKSKSKPSRSSRASTSTSQTKLKPKPKSKNPRKKNKALSNSSSSSSNSPTVPRRLTARQHEDTLAAYALFFPASPKSSQSASALSADELSRRRLTIKEVASAAASIKEKITAEEVRLALYRRFTWFVVLMV